MLNLVAGTIKSLFTTVELHLVFSTRLYEDFGCFLHSEGELYSLYEGLCSEVLKFYSQRIDRQFNAVGLFKSDEWKQIAKSAVEVCSAEDLQMMDDIGSPAAKLTDFVVYEDLEEEKKQ